MNKSCCIKDYCGLPYDLDIPETRPVDTLRFMFMRYCPKHRIKLEIAFRIATPHGAYYDITTAGEIIRLDQGGFAPSSKWKLQGIEHVKRNEFIPFDKLAAFLATKPTLLYKNGHPQYTVRDLDHGTTRTWGNTVHHGIKQIWLGEVINAK